MTADYDSTADYIPDSANFPPPDSGDCLFLALVMLAIVVVALAVCP